MHEELKALVVKWKKHAEQHQSGAKYADPDERAEYRAWRDCYENCAKELELILESVT